MTIALKTTSEVSEMTGVSEATLRYWRSVGRGPRYGRLPGTRRIVYREQEVLDWINAAFEGTNNG